MQEGQVVVVERIVVEMIVRIRRGNEDIIEMLTVGKCALTDRRHVRPDTDLGQMLGACEGTGGDAGDAVGYGEIGKARPRLARSIHREICHQGSHIRRIDDTGSIGSVILYDAIIVVIVDIDILDIIRALDKAFLDDFDRIEEGQGLDLHPVLECGRGDGRDVVLDAVLLDVRRDDDLFDAVTVIIGGSGGHGNDGSDALGVGGSGQGVIKRLVLRPSDIAYASGDVVILEIIGDEVLLDGAVAHRIDGARAVDAAGTIDEDLATYCDTFLITHDIDAEVLGGGRTLEVEILQVQHILEGVVAYDLEGIGETHSARTRTFKGTSAYVSEAILIGDIHAREDHGLSVIRVEIGVQEGAILVKESTERSIEGVMLIFGRDQDIHETLRQGECALADLFDLCVHRDLFDAIVAVECAGQDPLHTTEGDGIPLDHGIPILLILDRRIALAVLL